MSAVVKTRRIRIIIGTVFNWKLHFVSLMQLMEWIPSPYPSPPAYRPPIPTEGGAGRQRVEGERKESSFKYLCLRSDGEHHCICVVTSSRILVACKGDCTTDIQRDR